MSSGNNNSRREKISSRIAAFDTLSMVCTTGSFHSRVDSLSGCTKHI